MYASRQAPADVGVAGLGEPWRGSHRLLRRLSDTPRDQKGRDTMATVVASRSGQLARPGAHLEELDEADTVTFSTNVRPTPTTVTDHLATSEETSAREIRWVCEWWPPT